MIISTLSQGFVGGKGGDNGGREKLKDKKR